MNGSGAESSSGVRPMAVLTTTKLALYAVLVGSIVALDAVTKYVVQQTLVLYHPVPVLGDFFRLTYIYNPGAAFGLHLGDYSRYIFLVLTVVAVVVLFVWYRSTPAEDRLRLIAIASVTGGAIGNLIDRILYGYVLDFFDFYLGGWHFWAFNVADAAINIGVALMILEMLGVGRLYRVSRTI